MKSISPIKFFTAVGFLVVSMMVPSTFAQKTRDCSKIPTETEAGKIKKVECDEQNESIKEAQADKKEAKCDSALEKFKVAQKEAAGVCDSFAQTTDSKDGLNTCENRVKACRNKISSAGDSASPNGSEDLMNLMLGAYMQKKYPEQNPNNIPTDNGTTGRSCSNYKSKDDRKEQKTEKKDAEKEIKQLNKDIADEKKKINEENAKLREKNAEIDIDLQKVDESLKKAIRSVDEKKAANLKKINDDLAKNGISIRNLNSVIIKQKEAAETAKFDYAQRMMQFTQDKISNHCNTEIDKAKQCFLQSSKGKGTPDPKDPCGGFTFSGKGAKGTAQLKAKIQKVREACFEQANMSVNKSKFEQSKSLRTIETDIIEKTNQVQDANNDIAQKQKNIVADNEASDKERTDEEKNAEKQIENFKTKLERTAKSTQEAIMSSNERMAQLQKEIDDAKIRQLKVKAGVLEPEDLDTSLKDAETDLKVSESARNQAIYACCPNSNNSDLSKPYSADPKASNSEKAICSQLVGESAKQKDKKGYTNPGTSQ